MRILELWKQFSYIAPNIFLSDSPELRSRSLKNCVYLGLGQSLNKQKPICSEESGMDGFRICNTNALLASFVLNGINQCECERIMQFRRFDCNVTLILD